MIYNSLLTEPQTGHLRAERPEHLGRGGREDGQVSRHEDALQQRAQVAVWDHGQVSKVQSD